jgi:hypothetical protein
MCPLNSAWQTHWLLPGQVPSLRRPVRASVRARARVRFPPRSFNETAIQINLFSSDVAIMVETLGRLSPHGIFPKHVNWQAGISVSLRIQPLCPVSLKCVGHAPTTFSLRHTTACKSKRCDHFRSPQNDTDRQTKRRKWLPCASTRAPAAAGARHCATIRAICQELALKVQGTTLATGAAACDRRRNAGRGRT